MSIISSFANYGTSSNLSRTRVEALEFKPSSDTTEMSQPGISNTQRVQPTFKVETSDNQRNYEEALARMLVNLNAIPAPESAEADFSIGSDLGFREDNVLTEAPAETEANDPLAQFLAYMDMSPAEKMRDKVLKEIGMTEEEIDALPPEQQEQIEKEIAEKIQMLQELQAAEDEQGNLHEHA